MAHAGRRRGRREPEGFESPLLRTVLDQASPFATELASMLSPEAVFEPEAPPKAPAPPLATAAPAETPAIEAPAAPVSPAVPAAWPPAPVVSDGADLEETGLSAAIVADLVRDVEAHAVPFTPGEPVRDLLRAELARRIRVRHGWRTKRRTIALVGAPGSGKTLAAAKLCRAYAGAGRMVAALSLEPARNALRLGALTEGLGVTLDVAECPDSVPLAAARLREAALVVADTPAVAIGSPASVAELVRLLKALDPDEIHLVLRAGTPAAGRCSRRCGPPASPSTACSSRSSRRICPPARRSVSVFRRSCRSPMSEPVTPWPPGCAPPTPAPPPDS